MRILFLTTYFSPDISANGSLMFQLAEDLSKLGHKVGVITSFPHYAESRITDAYRGRLWVKEDVKGMRIDRLYVYVPKRKSSLFGRLANYGTWNFMSTSAGLLAGQYDVLFVPSPPLTNGLSGYFLDKLMGMPFVYNVQDIYPDIAVRLGVLRGERIIGFSRWLESFIYSRAAAVSVISESFKRNLLTKRVPASKIHVIPNFVDTEFLRPLPRRNEFSTAQGLDDRFVVLFAGNMGLSQGLESILEAGAILEKHPEIILLFVGDGASKASLVRQAEKMKLGNVRFLSYFPYRMIPEIYASSDVCLVPLKYGLTESVPSKVLSVLAAGRPVIASVDEDSDAWRLVAESESGLCVHPEDPQAVSEAIMCLYEDRESGSRMGKNGRILVEDKFSRMNAAREYERLFRKVVCGGD